MKKLKRCLLAIMATFLVAAGLSPAAASAQGSVRYVALGDSVAAGLGLAGLPNPSTEDTACQRSSQAYANYVAAALGSPPENVACSGAEANDLYHSQTANGVALQPQIDAAFAQGAPDVISITVGANDIGWTNFLKQCYAYTCGGRLDNWAAKTARGLLRMQLFKALWYINQKSGGHPPKVLLTGYYTPFSTQQCSDTHGLTNTEKAWLNSQTAQLNQAISSVTPWFGFAHYVPIDFSGHELCSTRPWIQGLQTVAPFHPTIAGQKAIAQAILAAY